MEIDYGMIIIIVVFTFPIWIAILYCLVIGFAKIYDFTTLQIKLLPERVKEGQMTLVNRLKKLVNKDIAVLAEAGYLDSELRTTQKGREQLYDLLFDQHIEELAKRAKEELKDK